MQGSVELAAVEAVGEEGPRFPEYGKPDASEDDEDHERDVETDMAPIVGEAVAEQGKTGVAEGRDRMKKG